MDNIKVAEVEQTIQKEKECVFASSGGLPVFTSGSTSTTSQDDVDRN